MTAGSYTLEPRLPELGSPVLVHGLTGFMDAGGASRLAIEHLLETCKHTRVATFDIDSIFDFRGRRPRTVFDSDHYVSVAMPELLVDAAVDERGEGVPGPARLRAGHRLGGGQRQGSSGWSRRSACAWSWGCTRSPGRPRTRGRST